MSQNYKIQQSGPRQSLVGTVGIASRITFLAKRTPVVTTCFIASILLFIVSLTQDCFFINRAENPRAWANGFGLLMTGWLGVLVGVMAWVANPTLLIAWLAMWSPNHKRYSIGASAIALLLALSFLQHESIVTDEAGNRSMITGYGIGYWLWIGSIAIALVGSCSWISVLWQELNTCRKRVQFVAAIIGLVVVFGAALGGSLLSGIVLGIAVTYAVRFVGEFYCKDNLDSTHGSMGEVVLPQHEPADLNNYHVSRKRIKHWALRLPFVVFASAGMGWLGLILMYLGTPYLPAYNDFWTQYVAVASIVIWASLSFFLCKCGLREWLVWGFMSPLLGSLLVAPPASLAFVIIKAYISFPFGIATGALMWWIVNLQLSIPCRSLLLSQPTDGIHVRRSTGGIEAKE